VARTHSYRNHRNRDHGDGKLARVFEFYDEMSNSVAPGNTRRSRFTKLCDLDHVCGNRSIDELTGQVYDPTKALTRVPLHRIA
jgi:hypothetical protein